MTVGRIGRGVLARVGPGAGCAACVALACVITVPTHAQPAARPDGEGRTAAEEGAPAAGHGAVVAPGTAATDAATFATTPAAAGFVGRTTLPDGTTVTVAEGESEPRSIGSYAIRAYAAGDPAHPTDRFVAGLVWPRDGAVERVLHQDLDRDGRPEVIVVVRSAGSGGYLSADAFSVGERRIARRGSVKGLAPDTDPVAALRARIRRATAP